MKDNINIVIAGVGGQGTLVAGKLFGALAVELGLDVKISEVHGMSQRGGSVVTYVRMGEKVYSPVVEKGGADYFLAFEELEALRYADYLSLRGVMIINSKNIEPVTVRMETGTYPENIVKILNEKVNANAELISLDADDLADRAGNTRTANIVMIGKLSSFSDIPEQAWINAIEQIFPEKLIPVNIKAFRFGRGAGYT